MRETMKGKFKPANPQKYHGNVHNIVYRSSWELKMMQYFDSHPEVVRWSNEEHIVPYKSPVDRKFHRYFPDFVITKKNGETFMIEVKPAVQTKPPKKPERMTKAFKERVITYAINEKKWEAAREYCADRGWKFEIMTEKELYPHGK